jgi:flagellar hook-associated protein 2
MADTSPLQSISGLASGLDTSTIISQLMSIEKQPQVRLQQQQDVEATRQQALKDVQTRLQNLSSAIAGLRDTATWAPTQSVTSGDTTKLGVQYLSGAAAGSYLVKVNSLARADQWQSNGTTLAANAADTLHVAVGSSAIDVSVGANDTIETIASKINGTSGTPVFASVVNHKLTLSGIATGAASTISISSTGTLAGDLGFTHTITAADASYDVDSGAGYVNHTSASNVTNEAVPGVQLTLMSPTAAGSSVSVTVGASSPSTDAITQKVQAFVDQYNSTTDFIRGLLDEQIVANPQSQADREKGVLHNDMALSDLLSNMRQAVSNVFGGRPAGMNQLAIAGLSTGATTGSGTLDQDSVNGKLTLDSAKLATALTSNFTDVKAMFSNFTGNYTTEGLGQRLDDLVNAQISPSSGILTSRIASEDSMITMLQDQQADMQTRLDLREQMLKAQFTAMETALSSAQSQQQWLSGQIASLG